MANETGEQMAEAAIALVNAGPCEQTATLTQKH